MIDILKNIENFSNGSKSGSKRDISSSNKKTILLQIKPLRENDRGIEQRIAFLRNLGSIKGVINLRINGNNTSIKLYISCDNKYLQFIENMFYASYPESELVRVENTKLRSANEFITMSKKTIIRENNSYKQGDQYMSPFHDVLSLYNTVDSQSELTIQITLQLHKEHGLFMKAVHIAKDIIFPSSPKTLDATTEIKSISTLEGEVRARIGFSIHSSNIANRQGLREQFLMLMKSFITAGKIDLKSSPPSMIPMLRSQVVNFFHLPTQQHFTKALDYAVYRKLPYPYPLPVEANTPKNEFTLIGTTDYRNDKIDFGMIEEDKFRHMYVVGKTGTGKSTFLSNLIANDIKNGKGVGLLDPHGELVETVLEHIPSHRTNDVILFDVADSEFPIGFNLLQYKDADEKIRIVSGVVTTFQKLFAHSRGPRLEYILRNILLSIVDYPNATIMHILRILTDKQFREEVLKHVTDTLILKFWRDEYDKRDEKQKQEAMGPITNKIGQFLSSTVVRNIFGQPKSKLNLREAMDNGKIILINLSKGKIGEDNANMIGSLLVTKFQIDAMSRSDMRAEERRPFYLYIDEFQNFATDSFAVILSEARKYKLSLIMANQYTSQLLETIRDAIFGNIGSIFSFTIGYDDAKVISNQFKELVTPNDLISLPRFTAYTRMMIDGVTSDPFSMKTKPLPSPEGSHEQTKKIIEQSRQRYAMPRSDLERLLNARHKKSFSPAEKIALRGQLEGKGYPSDAINAFLESGEDDRDLRWRDHKDSHCEPRPSGIEIAGRGNPPSPIPSIDKENRIPSGKIEIIENQKPSGVVHPERSTLEIKEPINVAPNNQQTQSINNQNPKSPNTDPFANSSFATPPTENKTEEKKVELQETKSSGQQAPIQESPSAALQPLSSSAFQPSNTSAFSISDIILGQSYSGYIKLQFNYGLFVTVKGVEGLLHKNEIICPEGVSRKKYFTIGDPISVIAKEFKDVEGEKRVVWSMK